MESERASVLAGVPQGFILGPLIFFIYILNDIANGISSYKRHFADDTSFYIIVDNPVTADFNLNSDPETINNWTADGLVDFDQQKTSILLAKKKQQPIFHPTLERNNVPLQQTTNHKHLGIIFSNSCTWSVLIETIIDAAWKGLNLLRILKFKANRQALEKMYTPYVRQLLENSDTVIGQLHKPVQKKKKKKKKKKTNNWKVFIPMQQE